MSAQLETESTQLSLIRAQRLESDSGNGYSFERNARRGRTAQGRPGTDHTLVWICSSVASTPKEISAMAYYKGWKTVAETAELYGVTPMTVRRWLKAGYLTGIRLGPRVLLVDPDSIVNKGAVI